MKKIDEEKTNLSVLVGKDTSGGDVILDLAEISHLLVTGMTGSGKSTFLRRIIDTLSSRLSPNNLRLILIDTKRCELFDYNGLPHLLTPVITDTKKTVQALRWLAFEIDRRLDVLEQERQHNIFEYHKNLSFDDSSDALTSPERMPHIAVIIDELSDVMQSFPKETEACLPRILSNSRAVGVHVILSTSRPSPSVISKELKMNIPGVVTFRLASSADSKYVIQKEGAELLSDMGSFIYAKAGGRAIQGQAEDRSFEETKKSIAEIAEQYQEFPRLEDITVTKEPTFWMDGEENDELYEEAREAVINSGSASTSYLQRKLGVGYARASRLIDMLEEKGVITHGGGTNRRKVLVKE